MKEGDPLLSDRDPDLGFLRSQVPGGRGYRGFDDGKMPVSKQSAGQFGGGSQGGGTRVAYASCVCCIIILLSLFKGYLIYLSIASTSFKLFSKLLTLVYSPSWSLFIPLTTLIVGFVVAALFVAAFCGCAAAIDRDRTRQFVYLGCTCCCAIIAFSLVIAAFFLYSNGSSSAMRAANEICLVYNSSAGIAGCNIAISAKAKVATGSSEGHTTLTQSANVGDTVLHVASQVGFSIGQLLGIGGAGNAEINKVVGFGTLVLEKPLQHNYGVGTEVTAASPTPSTTKVAAIAAPTPAPPPAGSTTPWASQVVGNRLDGESSPAVTSTTAPPSGRCILNDEVKKDSANLPCDKTSGFKKDQIVIVDKGTITEEVGTIASIDVTKLVLKQKLTFDHTLGTIVEDGTPAPTPSPTLRRLNGIPADIDLDIEEESHYAMELIPFRRLSTSADPAHAAAEAFIPTSSTASAPTQENCDDATSLCRIAPFGYNSATACACNGQTDTLNSTTVGGYCSAWGSGWGAESWCYVNSGVLNCGLVETLTLTSSKSRSPGPCSQDAIVSQSNAMLEGKWLYKVTLLVGIMLSMFSCCAVCLGFFMTYTLSPRKAQKGGVALLARPAMKGDEYLELDHYKGFQAGQTLVIDPGGFAEEVNHIEKMGSIFLATPLQFGHNPGTRVESIVNHMVPIDIGSDGMMFQETLNADWSLEEQFRWAQKMATAKLSDSTPEHVRNELYGYFHQAVDGNNTGRRPSIFYADEQHKFDAWNRLQGMPRNEAMRLYIDSVQTLLG